MPTWCLPGGTQQAVRPWALTGLQNWEFQLPSFLKKKKKRICINFKEQSDAYILNILHPKTIVGHRHYWPNCRRVGKWMCFSLISIPLPLPFLGKKGWQSQDKRPSLIPWAEKQPLNSQKLTMSALTDTSYEAETFFSSVPLSGPWKECSPACHPPLSWVTSSPCVCAARSIIIQLTHLQGWSRVRRGDLGQRGTQQKWTHVHTELSDQLFGDS